MDANPSGGDQKSAEIITNGTTKSVPSANETCVPPAKENQPTTGGKGAKHSTIACEKKLGVSFDEKIKIETDIEFTELLGSVTTQNCPGTRTSARVIQKMMQDQIRPVTPPPVEPKPAVDKAMQKTPSQIRSTKPIWSNLERDHFFDALNEFGKDFEAIGNYINAKLKRKSTTDFSFKTKDQVRQHYYQTFHKICKYLKFSDEVKKPTQEMYALINYGEMRRKLPFVTDKHFMKLRKLVYQGDITVRCKGKNIRVKTPSCKVLRKLNQLDDSLEDIRLPSKIEVVLSPANIESYGRVQTLAQNPRVRTTVPLQKKLVTFINAFQYKWRSQEMKLAEEAIKLFPPPQAPTDGQNGPVAADTANKTVQPQYQDPEICFRPKPGVPIHRPLLSITECLSSHNICLSAYEERMGYTVRGALLNQERIYNKRQRTESGSDKKSPETKKLKQAINPPNEPTPNTNTEEVTVAATETVVPKSESSGDEFAEEIKKLLSDITVTNVKEEPEQTKTVKTEPITTTVPTSSATTNTSQACPPTTSTTTATTLPPPTHSRSKRGANSKQTPRPTVSYKPLISNEAISRIRNGWTVSNAADITIGDLYVVLGQESKLELDYYWIDTEIESIASDAPVAEKETTEENCASSLQHKQAGLPYNPNDCDNQELVKTIASSSIGNKLKHLLLLANMSGRMRKRQCSCGHICDRNAMRLRIERERAARSFISNRIMPRLDNQFENSIFRQPAIPLRRPPINIDPIRQLNSFPRSKLSRQVLVQRLLLPGNGNRIYDLLDPKHLQNNLCDPKPIPEEKPIKEPDVTPVTVAEVPNSQIAQVATTSNSAVFNNTINNVVNNIGTNEGAPSGEPMDFTTSLNNVNGSFIVPCVNQDNVECVPNNANGPTNNEVPVSASMPDIAFDDTSNASLFAGMSPMHLLRDTTSNTRWLEENINDFSFSSLLGHLEDASPTRDILDPSSAMSVISESSVDFMHKFQEISALMQSQDKD